MIDLLLVVMYLTLLLAHNMVCGEEFPSARQVIASAEQYSSRPYRRGIGSIGGGLSCSDFSDRIVGNDGSERHEI